VERQNLELKVPDPDPAGTERHCRELGAVDQGTLVQRDTYFDVAAGRLKLREQSPSNTVLLGGPAAELIYYERPTVGGVRTSRYWRVPAPEPEALRDVLGRAAGILGVVHKERRLYLWSNVRIHLDEVAGLGSFVELEAVAAEQPDVAADQQALDHVAAALALRRADAIAGSYLDLLLAR
jgi:adenylate cyclase class IV